MHQGNFTDFQKQKVRNYFIKTYGLLLSDSEVIEISQNLLILAKASIRFQNLKKIGGKVGR